MTVRRTGAGRLLTAACRWAATCSRARVSKAPTFVVCAVKDPTSGNLDRIQIVKGWARDGQSFEKVHDVVWAGERSPDPATGKVPAIGSTVDIANATYTNDIGSVELDGHLDRPGVRPLARRLLLRPRARDPDPALDHHPGEGARHRAAADGRGHRAGARLVLADLVHARGGGARRLDRHDGRRPARSRARPS